VVQEPGLEVADLQSLELSTPAAVLKLAAEDLVAEQGRL
jgi:hypothetical protein